MEAGNLGFAGASAKGNRFFAFDYACDWDYAYEHEEKTT
jgi:hypothetical protein